MRTSKMTIALGVLAFSLVLASCFGSKASSSAGRGGMQSKCGTALRVAADGIEVLLARGTRENVLTDLVFKRKDVPHTRFAPRK